MPDEPPAALPVQPSAPRPLAAYRVVELPGAPHLPAGKAFADLGANVIKVEPPGGDPARLLPPVATQGDGSPLGLYWTAYSAGKRSVTVDLTQREGREFLQRLIATADVVIESYPPGVLHSLGLGYEQLQATTPGIVLTSITPFGQSGPYAGWKGSDLVQFAMGGYLYMTGPKDGTPIKPSVPYQTWLFGSMHAVAATMLALRQLKRTDKGAHVDQAMRDTGMWMLTHTYQFYDLLGINQQRHGAQREVGGLVRLPNIFQCLDGYVIWLFQPGPRDKKNTNMLVRWMAAENMAPAWLREQNWETLDLLQAAADLPIRLFEAFQAFFLTKRKAELLEWAIREGAMLGLLQDLRDVADDRQLAARQTWRTLSLDGMGTEIRLPGPPIHFTDGAWEPRGAPPAPGERTHAIRQEVESWTSK